MSLKKIIFIIAAILTGIIIGIYVKDKAIEIELKSKLNSLSGEYESNYGNGFTKLFLNEDFTFSYSEHNSFSGNTMKVQGNWHHARDETQIFLNHTARECFEYSGGHKSMMSCDTVLYYKFDHLDSNWQRKLFDYCVDKHCKTQIVFYSDGVLSLNKATLRKGFE
jgi:hypothetical protein